MALHLTLHSSADRTADEQASVLAQFRASQDVVRAEEARQIELAVRFALLHETDDWTRAASEAEGVPGGEGELLLGGEGCPWIGEFAVAEFAAATGRSLQGGRAFLAECLALVHRLPRTWRRVQAGDVDGWRARRVADVTLALSQEAAAWVDAEVAPRADRVGVRGLERLVEEAGARFDPEELVEAEEAALAERRVVLDTRPDAHGLAVTSRLDVVLDATDAHDLDAVLDDVADQLGAREGLSDSKAVRRARALGMLARGEVGFVRGAGDGRQPRVTVIPRKVDLHVRVAEGDTHALVHSVTGQRLGMVSIVRLREWCGHGRLTVRPVIDVVTEAVSPGRFPSARVREQVVRTSPTCVFPWCERPAEACDQDHIVPFDPDGPPGQTSTANLAPLCRHHHRVKTHAGWHYERLGPGEFLWVSPHGLRFHVARDGTSDLGRHEDRATREVTVPADGGSAPRGRRPTGGHARRAPSTTADADRTHRRAGRTTRCGG